MSAPQEPPLDPATVIEDLRGLMLDFEEALDKAKRPDLGQQAFDARKQLAWLRDRLIPRDNTFALRFHYPTDPRRSP